MEQKRLLWIIAATGVFLLVVLGAALIIYSPAAKGTQSIAAIKNGNKNTSNGWISLAPAQAEPENELKPFSYENDSEYDLPENGTDSENAGKPSALGFDFEPGKGSGDIRIKELTVHAENATVYAGNSSDGSKNYTQGTTTIDLNPTQVANTVSAQNTQAVSQTVTKKTEPVKVSAPAVSEKTVSKNYEAKSAESKPAVKAVQKPAPKVEPKKPMVTRYWVQVSSLTSRKSADAAREELNKNQISADVFTYTDKKGQMYYRVRVGPYTTKTEAEYWCSKIVKIDAFRNSAGYVTSTASEE